MCHHGTRSEIRLQVVRTSLAEFKAADVGLTDGELDQVRPSTLAGWDRLIRTMILRIRLNKNLDLSSGDPAEVVARISEEAIEV